MHFALLVLLYGDPVGTYETGGTVVIVKRHDNGWSTQWCYGTKNKNPRVVNYVGWLRLHLGGWEETWCMIDHTNSGTLMWTFTRDFGTWGLQSMKRVP